MHRCLNIVEVQRTIFRQVYSQYRGHATLARLARTCRAFSSVALDVLWVTLDSFLLLIQSLPRDLWKIDTMDRKLIFQRPMSLRDWEIFFRYSSRVRHVSQSLGPEVIVKISNLGDDVILALSCPPTYGPLVPHLRSLHWDKPNRKYAPLLRSLLTPSLVALYLPYCTLRTPEVSILTSIGTLCPSLKTLCIVAHKAIGNSFDVRGEKILSDALLMLHSLETLTCPPLEEAAIGHLSRLPRLADLSLELQLDFQLEKLRPYLTSHAFASVDTLTLQANALSTLTSLFELVRFKPQSVIFVVATTPTADALRLFFLALANACDADKLSFVSLTTSSERQRAVPSERITLSAFQSLLALPNIHSFEFDAPCDVALDDDAIATVTRRWPNLTMLSFNAKSGWGITPRVTHRGLMTLLAGCPALADVALSVDFSDVDGPHGDLSDARPGGGITNENCVSANFVTSAIVYPITIAAFLSDVCPELESVRSAWGHQLVGTEVDLDEMDVYRERWEEVENLLPAFSAVRRQCMEWAQKRVKEASVTGT